MEKKGGYGYGIIHVLVQRRLGELPRKQNKHHTQKRKTEKEVKRRGDRKRRKKDKAKKRPAGGKK